MYINKISFLIICVSSLLFSTTTYTDNELLLTLDPFDLSNFVLNKYHPNQNIDLTYHSIILDGSSNFPLYQSIPSEISFESVIIIFLISLIISGLASYLPVMRITNMNTFRALRYE